ncbi:MAG TPA: hypothetical protein VLJ39_11420, partial [Tepidisphaeraceae bacterium]|nr:hypothetical protein [Tepidisphaeraceae bacterium]
AHQPDRILRSAAARFPTIADVTMPARIMIPLAIVGLLGLTTLPRIVLWASLPLFVVLYLFYAIFLEHYAIAVIPAIVLMCLLGVRVIADGWPRHRIPITSAGAMLIVVSCLTSLWEINHQIAPPQHQVSDETFPSAALRLISQEIPQASDIHKPAVILFRYHAGDDLFQEPVYNTGVAWPDDASIIRAHDLGPDRDREIVDYYAAHGPVRTFYLFDLKMPGVIERLGETTAPKVIMEKIRQLEGAGK